MNQQQKRTLTRINEITRFHDIMQSLTIGQQLTEQERDFALACAIVFLREYTQDRRWTTYAELSYYIILKYCLAAGQYQALYDFSANFGYYPITRKLLADGLINSQSVLDQLVDLHLDLYAKDGYIETSHQASARTQLIEDQGRDIVYVAPTSYGKSSLIVDYIRRYQDESSKVAIIVPTKSLLMQTYRMIRQAELGKRVITHDEMYNNERSFIAVLTQERCLRLLAKNDLQFDLLFIDEAHKLFHDDDRSILLTRLLAENGRRYPNQRVVYLSPLIDEAINVRIRADQRVSAHTIPFNIKEADLFEYREKRQYQYNRFVNEFYPRARYNTIFDYILAHAKDKNFLYVYRPVYVEELAKALAVAVPAIRVTRQLRILIDTLKNEVHELFYLVELVEHGVIYLHGKLPDIIKEYLESKFSELPALRYLVANSVILEGVNLPVDNLYILNTYRLHGKDLTNLIGRVNRLNTIFAADTPASAIEKLVPPVHFVNNDHYNRANGKMENKIRELRSRIFQDVVANCTLDSYDIDALSLTGETKTRKKEKDRQTLRDEQVLVKPATTLKERLRQDLIESGIAHFYTDVNKVLDILLQNLAQVDKKKDELDFMDKIHQFLVRGVEDEISDYSFRRLRHEPTREFYTYYIEIVQRRSMKQNIMYLLEYYRGEIRKGNSLHYFGESYGQLPSPHSPDQRSRKTYLDMSGKSEEDLVNLAIVKLKMEDDFVSFKLNKAIVLLHDYELLTDDEFHQLVYGTTDRRKIEMTKLGMSISLISRLDEDGLLQLLDLDTYGNLIATEAFIGRKAEMSDLYWFEVNRFLV